MYFFNNSKASVSKSEFELPQFILADVQFVSRTVSLNSGEFNWPKNILPFQKYGTNIKTLHGEHCGKNFTQKVPKMRKK